MGTVKIQDTNREAGMMNCQNCKQPVTVTVCTRGTEVYSTNADGVVENLARAQRRDSYVDDYYPSCACDVCPYWVEEEGRGEYELILGY